MLLNKLRHYTALVLRRLRESKYAQDIIWYGSGNGLAQAIGVLFMPLLTRMYTPTDFGVLNLFVQIVAFLTIVLTWRYEYVIVLPKEESHARVLLRFLVFLGGFGAILATVLLLTYGEYVADFLGNHALTPWLSLAPLTALLTSLSIALQQRIQRFQDYRISGLSEVIHKSGYISSGLLGFFMLPEITGLMLASTMGMLGKVLWLFKSLQKQNVPSYSSSVGVWPVVQKYRNVAVAMAFSGMMLAVTMGLPLLFIAKMYGAETLGQFSLVLSTLFLPTGFIGIAIGQVYYERAAKMHALGKPFDGLWRSTAISLLLIGVPFYATVAVLSPWIYPLIFGATWQPAGNYAVWLSISSGLSFVTTPMDKSCLVVNVWWYLPLLHSFRLISMVLVIWLMWNLKLPFMMFLKCLVLQMSIIYIIDWLVGWKLSNINTDALGKI